MSPEAVRQYLLEKPEAVEGYRFGPDMAVMKVADKMFATLSRDGARDGECMNMNLKCDPHEAQILRDISRRKAWLPYEQKALEYADTGRQHPARRHRAYDR
ncbi:MAG: putative DNA-binding protein (MmcQ/YjbR family) [Bacteroidia bacterium]|jgi:predicted DNA-binding protein (MmcQ/YjbR family)